MKIEVSFAGNATASTRMKIEIGNMNIGTRILNPEIQKPLWKLELLKTASLHHLMSSLWAEVFALNAFCL